VRRLCGAPRLAHEQQQRSDKRDYELVGRLCGRLSDGSRRVAHVEKTRRLADGVDVLGKCHVIVWLV